MILLADPDPESRGHLALALETAGHRVTAVATGMEVLQVLMQTSPRLIVLDLDLKWVSGPRLIDLLRRNHLLARIPVLAIVSGYGARAPFGIPLVERPVDPADLTHVVARLAAAHHAGAAGAGHTGAG
jgi:CheY-like chemotaxis protein